MKSINWYFTWNITEQQCRVFLMMQDIWCGENIDLGKISFHLAQNGKESGTVCEIMCMQHQKENTTTNITDDTNTSNTPITVCYNGSSNS